MISFVKNQKDPATVFVIPTDMGSFRMATGCAILADKNLVYGPGLPEQLERIDAVNEFYNDNWSDENEIMEFMNHHGVNRIVFVSQQKTT